MSSFFDVNLQLRSIELQEVLEGNMAINGHAGRRTCAASPFRDFPFTSTRSQRLTSVEEAAGLKELRGNMFSREDVASETADRRNITEF